MTEENKWICLRYFHVQIAFDNRGVDRRGLQQELQLKLESETLDNALFFLQEYHFIKLEGVEYRIDALGKKEYAKMVRHRYNSSRRNIKWGIIGAVIGGVLSAIPNYIQLWHPVSETKPRADSEIVTHDTIYKHDTIFSK